MKNNLSIINMALIFASLISGFGCSYLNRSDANSANSDKGANTAATNKPASAANAANPSTRKPAGDAPMVAAPKIFEMVGKDEKGFNDQFKGREMIVLGEVDSAEAGSFYFYGGPGKTISCTMATGESSEKLESLRTLVAGSPVKKPIVEAIAVFRSGAKMASGDITVIMENCSIVSIKE